MRSASYLQNVFYLVEFLFKYFRLSYFIYTIRGPRCFTEEQDMNEKEKRGFWCGGKGSSGFQNQNLLRIQPLSWTAGDHMMVCSGLWRPQAQLFHIFSTTTNLVIHSKRENLQWSRMTKGAIRRQERGKSLRCNFAVLPHTTPLGFKSLKSLSARDQKWNSFHAFWNFTLWCVSFPLGL